MRILAVVVRYKSPLAESQTIQGLAGMFDSDPNLLNAISVLVWDNSPAPVLNPQLPFPFTYRHSVENVGVSGAYNRAMGIAETLGCEWLLLLDHDTTLPQNFLARMLELSAKLQNQTEIAAIAPFLVDGERTISPGQLLFNRVKLLRPPFEGVHAGKMYAANSGTLMRVSALRQIGGFDENFWLDLSDIVAFHLLHEQGKRIYIAGDLQLPHKVTLNDYDGSMSPQRYMNFVTAEGAYWDTYRNLPENLLQTMRLCARAVRQLMRYKNKAYSKITFAYFLNRLFRSKANRLRGWKEQARRRDLPAVSMGKVVG